MSRYTRIAFIALIALLIVGGPTAYAYYRQNQLRDLKVVDQDVLYSDGQLTLRGLKQAIHDHGIKTVITLRPAEAGDRAGRSVLRKRRSTPPHCSQTLVGQRRPHHSGGRRGQHLHQGHGRSRQLPGPHSLHAQHASDRHYCAVYRMEFQGWSNERTIEELRSVRLQGAGRRIRHPQFPGAIQEPRRTHTAGK